GRKQPDAAPRRHPPPQLLPQWRAETGGRERRTDGPTRYRGGWGRTGADASPCLAGKKCPKMPLAIGKPAAGSPAADRGRIRRNGEKRASRACLLAKEKVAG